MQPSRQALTDTEVWHWGRVPLRKGDGHCWHNVKTLLPDKVDGNECTKVIVAVRQPVKHETPDEVRDATMKDATTCKCHPQTVANKKKELTSEIMQYSTFRDGMTVQDGVVYKGRRAAIPKVMPEEIKKRSHSFHLGVECSLTRAWECIKDYVLSCEVCQKHNHAQLKEPIMPDPQPQYPWEWVSTVIMEYKSWSFLVTADYFSNFWELDELTCTPASAVIWKHKAHFTRCGTWTVVLWQRSSARKHWIRRIWHTVAIHTEHKSRLCPIQ